MKQGLIASRKLSREQHQLDSDTETLGSSSAYSEDSIHVNKRDYGRGESSDAAHTGQDSGRNTARESHVGTQRNRECDSVSGSGSSRYGHPHGAYSRSDQDSLGSSKHLEEHKGGPNAHRSGHWSDLLGSGGEEDALTATQRKLGEWDARVYADCW